MKYRQLGNSGLMVSEVSLGSWLTFGYTVSDDIAFKCMDKAIELGINLIDTADVYNRGGAEKTIGKYLKKINRKEIILATKVFGPMSDHWMTQGLSQRHIMNACQESLERLQTNTIDLYQCHRYDVDTPLEETCYAMNLLIQKGWIHHWGISQWSAVQILNALRVCEKNNWRKPISNQPLYNMFNRSLEIDVMKVCEDEGLGLIVYSPLAQGLLTGKYSKEKTPADSRMKNEKAGKFFPKMTHKTFEQIEKLKSIAKSLGITMTQLTLAWCLRKKPLTSVIIGATKVSQIEENCGASGVELSDELIDKIESILNNHPREQYSGELIGHGIVKRGY